MFQLHKPLSQAKEKKTIFAENEEPSFVERGRGEWRARISFFLVERCEEFDESGHLKVGIESNLSNLTPRIKVLREMERLALISAEGLHELKHKLLGYRAGDFWLPIGGLKKQDMDIPPTVTILLLGLTNSGKSSFINLMCSVLGRSGLIPFAQTSSGTFIDILEFYTTIYLEQHEICVSPWLIILDYSTSFDVSLISPIMGNYVVRSYLD